MNKVRAKLSKRRGGRDVSFFEGQIDSRKI
jgi:hypothetical protein